MAQRGRIIIISENEGQSTLECRSTPFCFCAIDMMWMLSLDDFGGDLTVFKGIQVASVCTRRALLTAAGGRRGSRTPGDQLSSFRLVPEAFPITIFETTRPFQEKGKKKCSCLTFQETPEGGMQKIKCAGPHPAGTPGR